MKTNNKIYWIVIAILLLGNIFGWIMYFNSGDNSDYAQLNEEHIALLNAADKLCELTNSYANLLNFDYPDMNFEKVDCSLFQ